MDQDINEKIRANPRFQALVKRRSLIFMLMFGASMIVYFGLIFTVAFAPELLRVPLSAQTVVTWGWPLGAFVVIGPWLLTLLFVHFANEDAAKIKEIFKECGL
jgi:uncharacterized membrane protein (DUF485 family)